MQPFFAAAACVLANAPLNALGLQVADPVMEIDEPDFLACDLQEPCGVFPSYYVGDLLATVLSGVVKKKADEVASRGRTPLVIHIGADGLRNPAIWTDVHLYTEVISDLEQNTTRRAKLQKKLNLYRQVVSQLENVKMVFVEPVASKASDFWANVARLPIKQERVELITAVADSTCKQRVGALYKFDHDLISRDFHPWDFRITDGWTAMEKDFLWTAMGIWAWKNWSLPCAPGYTQLGECKGDFQKLLSLPNRTSYIREIKVPCVTLRSLTRSVGGTLGDVVMLNVDTEGHDADILTPVASENHMRPAFIMWEGRLEDPAQAEVAHQFRTRGYLVGSKPGGEIHDGRWHPHEGDTPNIIAVPRGTTPELLR